jgi:hypothetical protein
MAKDEELLPAGTVRRAGEQPPPTKSSKALRAGYWAGLPVFMGCIVTAFQQFGIFYPAAPDWLLRTIAYILLVAGPILAYMGVNRTNTDQLRQPIETIPGVSLDGRPIMAADVPPEKTLATPDDIPFDDPPPADPPRPAPEVSE